MVVESANLVMWKGATSLWSAKQGPEDFAAYIHGGNVAKPVVESHVMLTVL